MSRESLYRKPLYQVRKFSNLKEMLKQSSELFGSKTAFLEKNKEKNKYVPIATYKRFQEDVDFLGTALMNLELKDKRIAIIGENRYEWAVSYMAVVNGTGVVIPIDKELPENEVESLLERSEVNGIIFSGKFKNIIKQIANKNKKLKVLIGMDEQDNFEDVYSFKKLLVYGQKLINEGEREYIDAVINNEQMSIMLFTSGTTSLSKAVMLSHKNICSNIIDMSKFVYYDSEDVLLSFLPLNHTYECTCGFLAPISKGASIAYCEGLRHIVKNLKETKATIMLSVPLVFETIYKHIWEQAKKSKKALQMKIALIISNFSYKVFKIDLRKRLFRQIHETFGGNVRLFISGGAGIDPMVVKGYRYFGIPFIQGYGLTECSPIPILNMDTYFKDSAIGLPLPSTEIKIEEPNKEGIGEIVVKGPNVMLGYYQNEEATKKVLKDGWFYTGDLGYIDKDGFVYVTGRKKDVIVTKNGKNIYPEEIEMLLNRSLYIKESMVFGKPDKDGDILICATIIADKEAIEKKVNKEISLEEQINKFIDKEVKIVNKKLPMYKRIREFTMREEELTKTTTKKIKRYLEFIKIENVLRNKERGQGNGKKSIV